MSRLIDANLIQYEPMLSPKGNGQYEEVLVAYKSQIDDLPTIEERKKKGKWIAQNEKGIPLWKCSCCGQLIYSGTEYERIAFHAYCNRCGADMRGEGHEID